MKYKSISHKMFFSFLGFITLILLIGWILISFFLQDYYEYKKIQTVKTYSNNIKAMLEAGDENISDEIEVMTEKLGGSLIIINNNRRILYASGLVGGMGRIRKNILNVKLLGDDQEEIFKTGFKQDNFYSFVYVKKLQADKWIIFEIPINSIEETVDIIQNFFGYLAIIAIFISAILSYVFSKTVTKPLIKLNRLAMEIQKLNFKVKYSEQRDDEIGHLGNTFNLMTEKLENTINKLKIELEKEKNLDSMRKQFVAQVSHELQTPLSVIKGYSEALTDGIVDNKEEQDYYYDVIQYEANKMSNMIHELLDLSQLESGVFSIKKQRFDIILLLNEVINKYKALSLDKDIQIEFSSNITEFYVDADEIRIEQVITNFINNALNHVDEKKYIEVNAYKTDDGVNISVFNSGNYIAESDIPYIWESFYKVKDSEQGTGLGLAISKSILQHHRYNYYVKNVQSGVQFGFIIK